jgi:hypothetical protein
MVIITVCISFIVTILGVGFPLVFSAVSKFDETYSSDLINDIFNKKSFRKYFKAFLIASIIISLIYMVNVLLLVFYDNKIFDTINLFSNYLMLLITSGLVGYFLHFTLTVINFSTPTQLFNLLMKKDSNKKDKNNFIYINAIADLLVQTIKNEKVKTTEKISNYLYDIFMNQRSASESYEILYPTPYYDLIYRTAMQLIKKNDSTLVFLEYRTFGGLFLFGEYSKKGLHQDTLYWIWRLQVLSVENKKDDLVLYYWENANRYYQAEFRNNYHDFDDEPNNDNHPEKINKQKEKFLEFNYFLGGLLLYSERFDCINRIWSYTTSDPPVYHLLPNTIDEIFDVFFQFQGDNFFNRLFLANKYSFPKQNGINSDRVVLMWVSKYITLLFLRQYKLYNSYGIDPLRFPNLPTTQANRKKWLEGLDLFKHYLVELLEDKAELQQLKLEFLDKEWCKLNDKIYPLEFIEKIKDQVQTEYDEAFKTQPVSPDKEKLFYKTTSELLGKAFKEIDISNNEILADFSSFELKGVKQIFEKSAFADDQGFDHLNFHSVLAEQLSNDIKVKYSTSYYLNATTRYLIEEKNIFEAIDICIGELNPENFVIISFRNNINYFIDILKIPSLDSDNYKGSKIYEFSTCNYRLVGRSFFILRKIDLPNLQILKPDEALIKMYNLKPINEKYNIFSNVIDIHKNPEIKKEYTNQIDDKTLETSVLAVIEYRSQLRWKKGIDMAMIKTYSQFDNRGLPNKLEDVNAFN